MFAVVCCCLLFAVLFVGWCVLFAVCRLLLVGVCLLAVYVLSFVVCCVLRGVCCMSFVV